MKRLILVLLLTAKAHASYILVPGGGGGGGGVSIGGAVSGGDDQSVLFVNPAGTLSQDSDFKFDASTNALSVPNIVGDLTGNADTATALAANPTGCPPGEYAIAIDTQANLTCAPAAGAGTVTSVGLSLPSEFTVTGSPVTSSGTLTGSWASASQNFVFAGPSGSAGTPAFRALVTGDLPTIPVSKGGTGLTSTPTNGQIPIGNGTGYTLSTITGTTNQVNVSSGSGTITLSTPQNIDTSASVQFDSGLFTDSILLRDPSPGTETVSILAPYGLSASYGFMFPPDTGSNGQFLRTDGGGGTSWASPNVASQSYELEGLTFVSSVAANALTLALKNKSGNDPSSGSPVRIGFRSSTLSSAGYEQRSVTGALSITVSSGSTLGFASGAATYLYLYAIDNAGTVELAISRSPYFDEGKLWSTTAEGGAGAADSNAVLYSTTARSNVPIRLIGRGRYTEATAGTWSTNAAELAIMPFELESYDVAVSVATGTLSGSDSVAVFTTINDDRFNSYNVSNGAITVPFGGVYSVASAIYCSGTFGLDTRTGVGIQVNGSNVAANLNRAGGAITNQGSGTAYTTRRLSTGDTVRAVGACNAGSPTYANDGTINYLNLIRIGP